MYLRRPMIFAAAAFAAAIFIYNYIGVYMCALICTVLFAVNRKAGASHRLPLILLICFTAASLEMGLMSVIEDPLEEQVEQDITVYGRILHTEKKYKEDTAHEKNKEEKNKEKVTVRCTVKVMTKQSALKSRGSKTLISIYEDRNDLIPGRIVQIKGAPEHPDGKRNPNCFNYRLYLKGSGIRTIMKSPEITVLPNQKERLQGRLYLSKEAFLARLESRAGAGCAGLMRAILFGEKSSLDEEVLETFQKNGTAHILAVSGPYVSIIGQCAKARNPHFQRFRGS